MFGPSWSTVYRRFGEWGQARVWAKLYRLVLDELGQPVSPPWGAMCW